MQFLKLSFAFCVLFCLTANAAAISQNKKVLFFSGGSNDDMIVQLLLLSMPNVTLEGIVVLNADTLPEYAMQSHWKVAKLCRRTDVLLGLSRCRGWNPFPYEYRKDAINFSEIDILKQLKFSPNWPPYPDGDALARKILKQAYQNNEKIDVLITAPITPLAKVIQENPELESVISRVVFMGGAVDVDGNLDPTTIPRSIANTKAEWNIFWDPEATDWFFKNTSVPIFLIPLDITNKVPASKSFLDTLEKQQQYYVYSRIAFQGYQLTLDEPFYRLWNTTAACYLAAPEYFATAEKIRIKVITAGKMQGAFQCDPNGRLLQVLFDFSDLPAFYKYFTDKLRR